MENQDVGRPGGLPELCSEPFGLGHSAGIPDADICREFRTLLCRAATRVAKAEFFRGPVDMGKNIGQYLDNIKLTQRVEDEALDAMISVVLFAKANGDAIIAARRAQGMQLREDAYAAEAEGLQPGPQDAPNHSREDHP